MNQSKIQFLREYGGQPIYLCILNDLEDIKKVDFPWTYYRALAIIGSQNYTTESLRRFAEGLLASGCRYIMTFGTDAEKLHNEADLAIVDGGYENEEDDDCILTTSHELIEEAIWYAGSLSTLSSKWDSELSPLVVLTYGNSLISDIKQLVLKIEDLESQDFGC